MENFMKQDMEEALQAITSMISRSEKAQEKFPEGKSQHTLLKNRIKALFIASALIKEKCGENVTMDDFQAEDFEHALAPITSLIQKSEKVQGKLTESAWQYTMLKKNLKALYIALALLEKKLSGAEEKQGVTDRYSPR